MAWLQHAAYWRNRESNPTQAAAHLNAVDWSLAYYEQTSSNPDYEILTPFGAYTAARMNAEHGRNYDIQKLVNWVFDRSNARPTKIMISGEQWGGQDVGGLMGFTVPNTGADVRGYAFSMNTFATAMPMVPLARYEDRYSRAIGKWMLNAANAARLFYADAHTPQTQSSEFWTGDPQSSVAYEGLRHHWLGGEFDGEEQYAAGDPLTYGWGPQTDFGIYGSAVSGVFGSIIKTTNVDKILQLDLLATDFYHDTAHSTYLYYNPYGTTKSVAINLGGGPSVRSVRRRVESVFGTRRNRADLLQRAVRRGRDARPRPLRRHGNPAGAPLARRWRGHRLQRDAAAGQSRAQSRRRFGACQQPQSTLLLALQLQCHLVRRRSAEPDPFAGTRRQQCDGR